MEPVPSANPPEMPAPQVENTKPDLLQPENVLAEPSVSPKKPKSTFLLLAVLGILLVGTGVVFAVKALNKTKSVKSIVPTPSTSETPVVDETANWQTYSNSALGYSIKFPVDWTISAKGGADINTFPAPVISSPCNYEENQRCSQIFIETGVYDPDDPTTKFEPNFIINLSGPNPDKITNKTTTKLDTEEATEFEYFQSNYGSNGRLLHVLVAVHQNTKYTITYEESQKDLLIQTKDDWQNKKVFDQILSTFKFLDETSASDTTNWQTYTNQKYGFSLKYPPDWRYKEQEATSAAQEIWFGTGNEENLVTLYVNKDKYLSMTKNGKLVTCQERGGEEITVGGNKAWKESVAGGQNPAQDWVCFEKNNRAYEFQHVYSTLSDSKRIFDQILSTFKFLD